MNIYTLVFLSLFIEHCKSKTTSEKKWDNPPVTLEEFNQNGVPLSCSEPPCPEGVVLIFSKDEKNQASRCTGFLMEPQDPHFKNALFPQKTVIATNAHCIPSHLKSNTHLDCSKDLEVHFIDKKKSKQSEEFKCKKILFVGTTNSPSTEEEKKSVEKAAEEAKKQLRLSGFHQLDYAFFTLNKDPLRTPFSPESPVKWTTIKNLKVWSILPGEENHKFVIRSSSCSVQDQGYPFIFRRDHDDYATIPYGGSLCTTVPGTSGSVLLNESQRAVGINAHSYPLKKVDLEENYPLRGGLNLNCACTPGKDLWEPEKPCFKSPLCEKTSDLTHQSLQNMTEELLLKTEQNILDHMITQEQTKPKSITPYFQWTFGTTATAFTSFWLSEIPKCYLAPWKGIQKNTPIPFKNSYNCHFKILYSFDKKVEKTDLTSCFWSLGAFTKLDENLIEYEISRSGCPEGGCPPIIMKINECL